LWPHWGGVERAFRTRAISPKPVLLQFNVPRVRCFDCDRVRQVKLGFADPKKHYTHAFERYVLKLSQNVTYMPASANPGSRPVAIITARRYNYGRAQRNGG
jgi:transposase